MAGRLEIAKQGLGFPAGKTKTILINLDGVSARRAQGLRLRTKLEIFGTRLKWPPRSRPQREDQRLSANGRATLSRLSRIGQADASSPGCGLQKLAGLRKFGEI